MPETLLVGAHFRPPAKLVLAYLPAGTPVRLQPEPENPWDSQAIRVLVRPQAIPEGLHPELRDLLPASGSDLESLLALDELWLGYLAREGNKDLAKWPELASNSSFSEGQAQLIFGPDGAPRVRQEPAS